MLNRVLLAVRGENGGQSHVWEIEPFGFASRMVDFGGFEIFRGPPYVPVAAPWESAGLIASCGLWLLAFLYVEGQAWWSVLS